MIVARNLNKRFGKIEAVRDLNFEIKKGTIHGLIGPEASGKSTILRILSTLIRPDSGEVIINNIPVSKGSQIRRIIGFVPSTPHLPLEYTARGLVTFAASLYGIHDKNVINSTLKQTGLDAVADQSMNRYSQTMEKNVAIAMAFVHNPQVLLLDEPMVNLDPVSQKRLKDFLLSSNKTVLMTGRDLDAVDGLCSNVTVLRSGSVVMDGELSSIRQKTGRGALEIRLHDISQIQKLIFELEKYGAIITASGETVYINYNSDAEIPHIIRIAANAADIMDARSVKLSVDDIFSKARAEGK